MCFPRAMAIRSEMCNELRRNWKNEGFLGGTGRRAASLIRIAKARNFVFREHALGQAFVHRYSGMGCRTTTLITSVGHAPRERTGPYAKLIRSPLSILSFLSRDFFVVVLYCRVSVRGP